MAISPDECLKLTDHEMETVTSIEQSIDVQLREKFDHLAATVKLAVAVMPSRVLRSVLENYRCSGWDVDVGVTNQDTHLLTFKKKSPSSGYMDR